MRVHFAFESFRPAPVADLGRWIALSAALGISLMLSSGTDAGAQVTLVDVGSTNIGTALDLKVTGHYAYLANGAGLRICDVSDAAHPISIAESVSVNYARGLDVSGNHVYLVDDSGLDVYDVSNPAAPVRISTVAFSGFPQSIVVSNSNAYLGGPGLCVYDVSDPTNITRLGQADDYSRFQVVLSGHYAYETAPNSAHTLYGYDVSNPTAPTNVYTGPGSYVWGIAVSGDHLFAASQNFQSAPGQYRTGLLSFDISDRTNPVYLSSTGGSVGAGAHVVVSGQYAYLGDNLNGLSVYDISNPTNLIEVGRLAGLGGVHSVQVSGPYAYVASNDGLHVVAIMPQLSVSLSGTNALLLSWPATGPFLVQTNTDLATANWVTLDDVPVAIGAKSQLVLSRPDKNTFYRLISR